MDRAPSGEGRKGQLKLTVFNNFQVSALSLYDFLEIAQVSTELLGFVVIKFDCFGGCLFR